MSAVPSLRAELVDTLESIEVFDITDPAYRQQLAYLADLTLDSISNSHTARAYRQHISRFLRWRLPLSLVGVTKFITESRLTVSNQRMALAAIRKLTLNAEADQLISSVESRRIFSIKPPKATPKMGRWLTISGVRQLLSLPNRNSYEGARDLALFALLLGCGLRAAEATQVTWGCYRDIHGRKCLVDIIGKGSKCRTIPVPAWATDALELWQRRLSDKIGFREVALDAGSLILRSLTHPGTGIGPCALGLTIKHYSQLLEIEFSPHDLRRTLAQLMRHAGVPIEQCQFILGHSSVQTTERYLGGAITLENGKAGVDQVPW